MTRAFALFWFRLRCLTSRDFFDRVVEERARILKQCEVGIKSLNVDDNGTVQMSLTIAKEFMATFAQAAAVLLDDAVPDAKNYLELQLVDPRRPLPERMTILIQRWAKKTPGDIAMDAKAEAATAKADLDAYIAALASMRPVDRTKLEKLLLEWEGSPDAGDAVRGYLRGEDGMSLDLDLFSQMVGR